MKSLCGSAFSKRGEAESCQRGINVDDYTRYLSSIFAGLSVQAANGSTKDELKRTAPMALRHLVTEPWRGCSGCFPLTSWEQSPPSQKVADGNEDQS
jgi:hypothetical protein